MKSFEVSSLWQHPDSKHAEVAGPSGPHGAGQAATYCHVIIITVAWIGGIGQALPHLGEVRVC